MRFRQSGAAASTSSPAACDGRTAWREPFSGQHRTRRRGPANQMATARPRWSLAIFFILTYAVTWACWIPVVVTSTPATTRLRGLLWLFGVFGPSLVALALTARSDGRVGVRALLGRILQWRVGVRWYLFAVTYMAATKLAVAFAHRIMVGSWPRFGHEPPIVMLVAILISTPVQASEEIGWRGYALPRLAERIGFAGGSVVLGIIWACWHLPQFFLLGADTYRQSFPIWAIEVTAISVAIAWLYTHTNGSLLLAMLMHAAINNTKDIVPAGSLNPTDAFSLHASTVTYLTAACLWVTAAYFLVRMPVAGKLAWASNSQPDLPALGS